MLCIQLTDVILVTWNFVQAVIFHSSREIVAGIGVLTVFINFQTSCSQLHEESTELIGSWAKASSRPDFIKFRKASKSILVPIGTFYFDRSLIITTMSIVLDNFVNLVVMFNSTY
jgi:hypothetical protein